MIKLNITKLDKNRAEIFEKGYIREYPIICYLQNQIEFLATHNKNYTKKQYNAIMEIKEIIDAMEIKGD